jgi:3-mercaptopyruvate sulfurtransferase SseA
MLQSLLGYKQGWSAAGIRTRTETKTMTPTELFQQLNEPDAPLVVDVRSPEEYQQDGHIAGARLLPLPVLLQRSNELPKDRPIVFVCRSAIGAVLPASSSPDGASPTRSIWSAV